MCERCGSDRVVVHVDGVRAALCASCGARWLDDDAVRAHDVTRNDTSLRVNQLAPERFITDWAM